MTADMSMSLTGKEAMLFAWDALWFPNQGPSDYVKLNILDVLQFSSAGMIRWLFTHIDGTVKSKSKGRWNIHTVMERLSNQHQTTVIRAHEMSIGGNWVPLLPENLNSIFSNSCENKFLVSFAHLSLNKVFIEQMAEIQIGSIITQPKFTTFQLCGAKAKGKIKKTPTPGSSTNVDNENNLPEERIPCLNKFTNELTKKLTTEIIRAIEGRTKCKISKIVVVAVIESEVTIDGQEKKVWMHHVKEVVFLPKDADCSGTSNRNYAKSVSDRESHRSGGHDRKSVTCSEITNSASSFQRFAKCCGDFCTFDDILEEKQIYKAKEGDLRAEARNAIRRHRRLETEESETPQRKNEFEMTSTNKGVDWDDDDDDEDDDEEDDFDELGLPIIKMKSVANKVPQKSIALAREDMSIVDDLDEGNFSSVSCPWNEKLFRWWWRLGRSLAYKKGSITVPLSAGHNIGIAMLSAKNVAAIPSITELNVAAGNGGDDCNVTTSKGTNVVIQKKLQLDKLHSLPPIASSRTSQNTGRSTDPAGRIPYDRESSVDHHDESRRSVGHLSWYYSEANVCEHCYYVYRDLDRRRKERERHQIQSYRKARDDQELNNGKEIERKMFFQRKFTSRLAKAKLPELEEQDKKQQGKKSRGIRHSHGGRHSAPAQLSATDGIHHHSDGVCTSFAQKRQHYEALQSQVSALTMGSFYELDSKSQILATLPHHPNPTNRKDNKGGAVIGALPPLPWQLNDDDQRHKYEQQGSSFIRNIGTKAQTVTAEMKEQKRLAALQAQGEKLLVGEAGLDGNSVLDTNFDWHAVTGQVGGEKLSKQQQQQQQQQQQHHHHRQQHKNNVKHKKTFNPERLLHPWQRELNKVKKMHAVGGMEDPVGMSDIPKSKASATGGSGVVKDGTAVNTCAFDSNIYSQYRYGGNGLNEGSMMSQLTADTELQTPMNLHQLSLASLEFGDEWVEQASTHSYQQQQQSYKQQQHNTRDDVRQLSQLARLAGGSGSINVRASKDKNKILDHPSTLDKERGEGVKEIGKRTVSFNPLPFYKEEEVDGDDSDGDEYSMQSSKYCSIASSSVKPPRASNSGNVSNSNSAGAGKSTHSSAKKHIDPKSLSLASTGDNDDDSDDSEDEGIGWSPFVIPTM